MRSPFVSCCHVRREHEGEVFVKSEAERFGHNFAFQRAKEVDELTCDGILPSTEHHHEDAVLDRSTGNELESEAFLSLCGEEKTQARMWSILQTGKPLRN